MPTPILDLVRSCGRRVGLDIRRVSRVTDRPCSPLPLVVEDLARRERRQITAVQIGANDGSANDPFAWCLAAFDIRALLVEPLPGPARRLRERHAHRPNITVAEVAVADHDGHLELFTFDLPGDRGAFASRVASFSRDHLEAHRATHATPDAPVRAGPVPCRTPARLLAEHGLPDPDILAVDAEGLDAAIVRLALDAGRPRVVHFEHVHTEPSELAALKRRLRDLGYEYLSAKWDTTAVLTPGS